MPVLTLAAARDVGLGRDEHDEEGEDNDGGEHGKVFRSSAVKHRRFAAD